MPFPSEQYKTLAGQFAFYYPVDQESFAQWIFRSIDGASQLLKQLLGRSMPELQVFLVAPKDWGITPHDEPEEPVNALPYWTNVTKPPSIFIPAQLDTIIGTMVKQKLVYLSFVALTQAFLEDDPRSWPDESPLWADEWQFQFAALWLMQQGQGQSGIVMKDLHAHYAEIFEPELDGKTPVTVRGFDWYEDTSPEDYLIYSLLLERFAADLLESYSPEILPRFLNLYRKDFRRLLSDEVTEMLANAIGPGGSEWLEELAYF